MHACKRTAILSDFLNNAHRDYKHCKYMAFLYKHIGKLERAINLILRRESKFDPHDQLNLYSFDPLYSACMPMHIINMSPSDPQHAGNFFSFFFFLLKPCMVITYSV